MKKKKTEKKIELFFLMCTKRCSFNVFKLCGFDMRWHLKFMG